MVSGDNHRDDEIDAREEEEGGDEVNIGLSACCFFFFLFARGAQLDTADAELKVPSVENPELMTILLLTPGVRQNYIATHALSTARVIFLVLTSTSLVRSFLLQILSILFDCFCFLANGINRSPCSPAFPYLLSVLFSSNSSLPSFLPSCIPSFPSVFLLSFGHSLRALIIPS